MFTIVCRIWPWALTLLLLGCGLSDRSDYQNRTRLVFPLAGETYVAAGGREPHQNPFHQRAPDQRFAMDIVALAPGAVRPNVEDVVEGIIGGAIRVYAGADANNLESHYCFGRPVLAPGDGVVVTSVGHLPDQQLGEKDYQDRAGNYLVIDHGNDEYSFLAHLQHGSVKVAEGDSVSAGEPVAACGNSGHSMMPHLHYHLQDSPELFRGRGLPARFSNYWADGDFLELGEPVQGQLIGRKPD